ncbi:ABC transporter permease [Methanobacterium congolense]|uniref:Macrolide export ATP-binding/permease protein MacB n=1 Tax=Methanobacterium congolense TaxID=118062 RepID=A0A1D3L445_9EURY|nr:Macrolide export ATP-binding/permease protein MacB [Methanobacterium congolense]
MAIFGIAIGIAAVVGLGLVTDGLTTSTQKALTAGAADLTVVSVNSMGAGGAGGQGPGGDQSSATISTNSSTSTGTINETMVDNILDIGGVKDATGVLETRFTVSGSQMPLTVMGMDGSKISLADAVITNGSTYSSANEVIIGTTAAKTMNKTIGDTITLSNETFKVVGIYQTGDVMEDGGVFMSLSALQSLTNSTGTVSSIMVKADNSNNTDSLTKTIESTYSNLTTTDSMASMGRMNNGLSVIETGSWAVSLLAVLISAVIVVLTMVKSVVERTREIGVLKAVGWTSKRVLLMIIGESIVLAVMASILGVGFGIVFAEILSASNFLPGIQLAFSAGLFLKAIGVAAVLGILCGLYPAYRASRLSPTEALRYE